MEAKFIESLMNMEYQPKEVNIPLRTYLQTIKQLTAEIEYWKHRCDLLSYENQELATENTELEEELVRAKNEHQ